MLSRVVISAIAFAPAVAAAQTAEAGDGLDVAAFEEGSTVEASCVESHVRAQKQRAKLELTQARDSLTACAQKHCPVLVRQDCLEWHQEVSESIPSFVLSATANGKEIPAASLYVDGALLELGLDGSAVELDPGRHQFRVVAEGYREAVLTLTARQGEKNRLVQLELERAVDPEPQVMTPKPAPPMPVGVGAAPEDASEQGDARAWVWGSALVAAVAGGVAISSFLDAYARIEDAESCRPFCDSGVTDPIRTRLAVATVAGGISVGALGVAAFAWFLDTPSASGAPVLTGARVELRGRF